MREFLAKAKSLTQTVATLDGRRKNEILNRMAEAIYESGSYIIQENEKDMELGKKNHLDSALLDRLLC